MLEGMLTLVQQKLHEQPAKWVHLLQGLDSSLNQQIVHYLLKDREDDHMSEICKVHPRLYPPYMPILF